MPQRWRAALLSILWLNATLIPHLGVLVLLPAIAEEFEASMAATAWVVLAYSLAMAGAFMPASHVGDMLGHKRVALAGSYMEVVLLLVIVAAPSLGVLIGLRFVHGLVHSLAVPNFNTFAIGGFPQEERGKAAGVLGATIGTGTIVVALAAGATSDALSWRWVFFIAAMLILAITVWGSWAFREPEGPKRARPAIKQFDIPGAALLMLAVAPLVIGVQMIRTMGAAWPWLLIGAAAVLAGAFVAFEARLKDATLPVRMFKRAAFAIPNVHNILFQYSTGVGNYILPVFFISGLGWTATYAGTVMIAFNIGRPPAAVVGGFLADRIGGRPVIYAGGALLVIAVVGMGLAGSEGVLWGLVPFMVLFGAGSSLAQTANQKQIFGAVPKDQLGMAPGVLGLGRHLGQSVGIGVAAALFAVAFGDSAAGADVTAGDGFRVVMLTTGTVVAAGFAVAWIVPMVWAAVRPRKTEGAREPQPGG